MLFGALVGFNIVTIFLLSPTDIRALRRKKFPLFDVFGEGGSASDDDDDYYDYYYDYPHPTLADLIDEYEHVEEEAIVSSIKSVFESIKNTVVSVGTNEAASSNNEAASVNSGAPLVNNEAVSTNIEAAVINKGAEGSRNEAVLTNNDAVSTQNEAQVVNSGAASTNNEAESTDSEAESTNNEAVPTNSEAASTNSDDKATNDGAPSPVHVAESIFSEEGWEKMMDERFARRLSRLRDTCINYRGTMRQDTRTTLSQHLFYAKKYELMVCTVAKVSVVRMERI